MLFGSKVLASCCCTLQQEEDEDRPEPLRIVKCIVRFPCATICCTSFVALLMSFIGVYVAIANSGPFGPFKTSGEYPAGNPIANNAEALGVLIKGAANADADIESSNSVTLRGETLAVGSIVFKANEKQGNVFSEAGVKELCKLHETITGWENVGTCDYEAPAQCNYTDFCLLRNLSKTQLVGCDGGMTPLALFYGDSTYSIDSIDLDTFDIPDFDDIVFAIGNKSNLPGSFQPVEVVKVIALYDQIWQIASRVQMPIFKCDPTLAKNREHVLRVMAKMREKKSLSAVSGLVVNYFFDKSFSSTNLKSRYSRTMYYFGGPLPGFGDVENNEDAQEKSLSDWWPYRPAYDDQDSALWSEVQPTVLVTSLLRAELLLLLQNDGLKAMIPLVMVFAMVWFQTGSGLVACATLFEMIISLTAALCVTTCLGITWMSFLQSLVLYIVLAIGADDTFVFMDAYKQSFYLGPSVLCDDEGEPSLLHRMDWVWRRAGLAMLITSSTTIVVFVVSALSSSIPQLQLFGLYAASVVLMDYLLVMTMLAGTVVIYHNCCEMKACCCCGGDVETTTEVGSEETPDPKSKGRFALFFEDIYPFKIIECVPSRVICIVVLLLMFIPSIFLITKLEPPIVAEQLLPMEHPFQRWISAQSEFAGSNKDDGVEIQFVWGLQENPLDRSSVNALADPDFKGTVIYDSNFVFDESAQTALLEDCNILRSSKYVKALANPATGTSTKAVQCFIEDFKTWVEEEGQSFPVKKNASNLLHAWYEQVTSNSDYVWVNLALFFRKVGDDHSLVACKVSAESYMPVTSFSTALEARSNYEKWEGVLESINADPPMSLGKAFQTAGVESGSNNKWIFMVMQETYVSMALKGFFVGLALAYVVLLIATRNFVVATISIVAVIGALFCVLGSIVLLGWKLGQNESLGIMVLTGFAVDYVVHLAHSYMESKSGERLDRVHDALRDMGISVFWGMLTSIASAIVLASCALQNLAKFGIFFLLTIAWAYCWSTLFLMPALSCLGPEADEYMGTSGEEELEEELMEDSES